MAADGDHSPLTQFEVTPIVDLPLGGVDISFTNASAFMVIVVVAVTLFVGGGMRRAAMVPGRWQSMVEMTYEFIGKMLYDSAGVEGRRYFPFVFTLFMFVLFANLIGMFNLPVPGLHAFTITSHIVVTFALAALVFVGVTVIGIAKNGLKFLKLFAPSGVHWVMLLLLVPIELLSYMIRPITLSVRLFANMMAGHTIMKVIAGFVVPLGVFGVVPLAALVALTGLEIIVAVLQAYVFAVLTCIYLNDALHPAH